MSAPKHTPRPWTYEYVQKADRFERVTIRGYGAIVVAEVEPHHASVADPLANARLIAEAPDLLAVLKELVDLEGPLPGNVEWARKAQAAIARAEGR